LGKYLLLQRLNLDCFSDVLRASVTTKNTRKVPHNKQTMTSLYKQISRHCHLLAYIFTRWNSSDSL